MAILIIASIQITFGQEDIQNASQTLMEKTDQSLTIGGYAQIDYNQPLDKDFINNGKMDVHRLVILFGYNFNDRVQFITEIEYEHVKEVFVEQAFINYRIGDWLNLRGGLMLIPMGIVNEYHEPPTFNGVERPNVDNVISPTTWREIGFGFTGRFNSAKMKYQLYLVNGFISYDGEGKLSGQKGLRGGRQKGANSTIGNANLAGKLEFFGVSGLNLGVSGYFGNTQSTLENNISKDDQVAISQADSSIIGISMIGLDGRFNRNGFSLRGQYNFGSLKNVSEYNEFTGKDLGSSINGFYLETAYDLLYAIKSIEDQLTPFIRYENYNTHRTVPSITSKNSSFHREEIIAGLGWKPASGMAFKIDIQFYRSKAESSFNKTLNAGIGVWF